MDVRTILLSEEQRAELMHYRDHDRRPDVRERCAAVLKIADGRSANWVASEGLLRPRKPDTIYAWLDKYELFGIQGLLNGRHGGDRHRPFREAGRSLGAASPRAGRGRASRSGTYLEGTYA